MLDYFRNFRKLNPSKIFRYTVVGNLNRPTFNYWDHELSHIYGQV